MTLSVLLLSWKNVAMFLELLLWENSRASLSPWIKHVGLTFYSCLPGGDRATAKAAVSFGLSMPAYLEDAFWWLGVRRYTVSSFFQFFLSSQGQRCVFAQSYRKTYVFWVKSSMQQYSCFSDLILSRQGREGKKCFLTCVHAVYFIVRKKVLLLFLFSNKGYGIWWSTSAFLVIKPDYSEVVSTVDGFSHFLIKICLKNPPWFLLVCNIFLFKH